jgi:hypothetical protein
MRYVLRKRGGMARGTAHNKPSWGQSEATGRLGEKMRRCGHQCGDLSTHADPRHVACTQRPGPIQFRKRFNRKHRMRCVLRAWTQDRPRRRRLRGKTRHSSHVPCQRNLEPTTHAGTVDGGNQWRLACSQTIHCLLSVVGQLRQLLSGFRGILWADTQGHVESASLQLLAGGTATGEPFPQLTHAQMRSPHSDCERTKTKRHRTRYECMETRPLSCRRRGPCKQAVTSQQLKSK